MHSTKAKYLDKERIGCDLAFSSFAVDRDFHFTLSSKYSEKSSKSSFCANGISKI